MAAMPSWISDRNDFTTFDLPVTLMLPTKFRVNWPFASGEEAKNRFFLRWPPWRPSWISNRDTFSYGHLGFPIGTALAIFDLQVTPMVPTKFKVNKPFDSGEEAKNRFSRRPPWRTSWISDQKDFSDFFLIYKSPRCFLPSLVNWLLGLGEEAKNRFSRWPQWRPSWISDRHDSSYFRSTSQPHASYQVSSQLAFQCRRRSEK